MKKYFKVSYQHAENIYCANIAHAETAAEVEAHYSKYAWVSVSDAAPYDVDEARRRGMPIVEIDPQPTAEEITTNTEDGDTAEEMKGAVPMFENLKNALTAEADRRTADKAFYILHGFMPSWAEEHRQPSDKGLKEYSTATRWNQYNAGTLSREKAVELATKRAAANVQKWLAVQLSKLAAAEAAPELERVAVSVEWTRSRTWGANPTATTTSNYAMESGHASGCGYDKESAAIAEALNEDPAVMRMLYTLAEKALADGESFKRFTNGNVSWGDVIGYGSGYAILPYFEGGVGSSCFWSIFKKAGYAVRSAGSGKMFDCWTVEKEVA